ncbi:MAG: PD-(D/E)XK nuclease-like domain-containing protein [Gammaproteobacteria bacterium]|nr:hypothetical protein [Rhodocyclaceae bacterium]MBU3910819.1 PD-(D/E)XK nuclease-like domain-containing protein [Gammaproteobacteria bacterium]MBU4006273.1 PD-(D/E)XK nuclease-like domain-containing protein [Gammaproteobacteria bacterium]MBU4097880.1 PD-(D/E)XK nuclease-like domain-containing protein [Gammaproteobacteria bacterium]MBU4148586.1 PD-(D/E)XK nuclease-like domain-containing protein [Gammaproteobacteria bacterium]
MKMENVGLLSMSSEQYHSNKEAVGHSGLVKLMRSPAHYQEYVANPPEPTPAMAFGTALHMAVLEPAEFSSVYSVFDESRLEGTLQSLDDYKSAAEALSIKVGKMKKDEIKDAIKVADVDSRFMFREDAIARLYGGKQILQPTAMLSIQSIQASISRHTGAARLLSTGLAEMSGFWMDSETGIPCKCRPDWLVMAGEMTTGIVDVKSCCDASAEGFARVIATMGYDLQAAYYQDGIKALTGRTLPFHFIAVEKDAPFATAVYKASDEMIEVGRAKYRGALQLLKWCRENDQWPAYQPSGVIEEIDLPRWAANFNLDD